VFVHVAAWCIVVVPMEISIAPELTGRVRLGILVLDGVTVREADPTLAGEVDAYCKELRDRFGDGKSVDIPGAADARSLYKALGLDPTKTRPASEALARRALKGETLYRINTLVDALNLCSLRAQLPFGLYDLDRIEPPILLRKGSAGESYEGIRKGPVNVEDRPVLSDARGPFGNPTSDSARTCIGLEAKRALVTIYAPSTFPTSRLSSVLDDTETTLTRHCGGSRTERSILPAG
jgi:DNA/RNA-binding domain of Phe-tRNA-synthetase-like protein